MRKSLFGLFFGILISVLAFEGIVRIISPLLGPPLVKWNPMEDAKVLKFNEFREVFPRPSYVLMGDSTVLTGFNPGVFDAAVGLPLGSSLNAAMNGSEIRQMRDFAVGYVIKELRPKNLIILFSNSSMAMNLDYEKFTSNISMAEKYIYIYKYRNTFRDPMTINTFIRIFKFRDTQQGLVYRWADDLDLFGYTKYKTTENTVKVSGWDPTRLSNQKSPKALDFNKSGLRHLEEIRDLVKAQGGSLIIGTVPTLSFDPNYRSAIKKMAKYLRVSFIQGNNAIGEGKYFQDGVHLNNQGADEFSKFLAIELQKMD